MDKRALLPMVFTVLLAAAGCTTVYPDPATPLEPRAGQIPPVNTVTSARVGQPILSDFTYYAARVLVTQASVDFRYPGGSFISIPAQSELIPKIVNGEPAACTRFPAYTPAVAGALPRAVCLYDRAGSGTFSKAWVLDPIGEPFLDVSVPYTASETQAGPGGAKYDLVYGGIQGNTVRITYLRYEDNLAYPLAQQQLVYNLRTDGQPTRIAFGAAEIDVLSADNGQIRYRVLRHLTG